LFAKHFPFAILIERPQGILLFLGLELKGLMEKRVAVITGASSGIGRATARLFAANGYQVIGVGRNQASLDQLQSEADASIGVYTADVTRPEQVDALVAETGGTYGRIDVLVNAAGII
jgi:NADP-dependent 3-hydroxy acid dehydrogenase YdfG